MERVRGTGIAVLALLGGLCLVYLGPSLRGDVFLSTEVVYCCTQPWSGAGAAPPPEHNPFLADHCTIYYPWLLHTRGELRAGNVPLWSGESYGGAPYFGNFSVGLLSPFTWLFVLLPLAPAFAFVAAVKWLVAGLGLFLLSRRLGLRGGPATFAAATFAFCGYQVVWINSALTHVSVLAPWCLLALEHLLGERSLRSAGWLALAVFLQLMGGHPETSFFLLYGCGIYLLVRLPSTPERGRALLRIALAAVVTLALSAVQVLPFLEYALASEGLRLRGEEFYQPLLPPLSLLGLTVAAATAWAGFRAARGARPGARWLGFPLAFLFALVLRALGFEPQAALQLLPDLHGSPLDGGRYLGADTYTDVSGAFCGGLTLLLCLSAFRQRAEPPVRRLLWCAFLVSIPFLRIPVLSQALRWLPGFEHAHASRSLAMIALFVSLLAGFGLQAAWRNPRHSLPAVLRGLCFGLGVIVPVETLAPAPTTSGSEASGSVVFTSLPATWDPREVPEDSRSFTISGTVPAGVASVRIDVNGVPIGVYSPTSASDGTQHFRGEWLGVSRQDAGRYWIDAYAVPKAGEPRLLQRSHLDLVRPLQWSPRFLLLATALAVLALACVLPPSRLLRLTLAATALLELVAFGVRYNAFTPAARLPGACAPLADLQQELQSEGPFRILGAGTALQPNLHYVAGLHALRGYDALEPAAYVAVLRHLFTDLRERIWDEQGFGTMDLDSPLADVVNLKYVLTEESQPDPGWVERWRRGSLALYENVDVLPRAFTVQEGYSIGAHGGALPTEDIRRIAVWDRGEDRRIPGSGEVESFEYRSGHMKARVNSSAGTLLIISENAAPGWVVTIDGRETSVRTTHGTFFSIEIPGGSHEVELRYLPRSVRIGAVSSLVAAAALLFLLLYRPFPRHG